MLKTSNDLRGPLMTLKGVCSLAAKEYPPAQEYINKIELIGEELIAITNRLNAEDKLESLI